MSFDIDKFLNDELIKTLPDNALLNSRDLCRFFGVKLSTIGGWQRSGKLPPFVRVKEIRKNATVQPVKPNGPRYPSVFCGMSGSIAPKRSPDDFSGKVRQWQVGELKKHFKDLS